MLRKYVLMFCIGFALESQGQIRHMFDTIRHDLEQTPSLVFGLDGKSSIIRDMNLKMYGVQAGYLYNKRTNIHLGFYTTFNREKVIFHNPTAGPYETDSNTIRNKFGMAYFNIEGDYCFFNTGKWRLSIPAGVGLGIGWDKFYRNDQYTNTTSSLVIPIELGFNASYKVCWWVWIGAGLGTRVSLVSSRYNGPFYTYGLQFQTEEIFKRSKKLFESF